MYYFSSLQGSTKTNLNKHVSLVHLKEKPYSCLLCPDAKFGQKSHLDNHMRQVHGGNIVTVALAPPVSTTSQGIFLLVSYSIIMLIFSLVKFGSDTYCFPLISDT